MLVLRTEGSKWYDAKLYGEFAELWFFLMKGTDPDVSPPVLLPVWSNLWRFGFGLFEPGRSPDCLHRLKRADLGGRRGSGGAWLHGTALTIIQSYNHSWCVHEFWSCETVGTVSRRLSVPVSVHMFSASHLHLYLLVVNMCITQLM